MKLTLILFGLLSFCSFGQTGTGQAVNTTIIQNDHFFGQCLLNITSETDFLTLEQQLAANPYVQVARVDRASNRLFLITKDIASFDQTVLLSWLNTFSDNVTCVQVGLHGIDQVNPFPFVNCQD